jgi:hypothetical protein
LRDILENVQTKEKERRESICEAARLVEALRDGAPGEVSE